MMYLDVWRSGTFPEKQQVSECATDRKHRLTSDSLSNVSWIQKATLQLYRRNVPLFHTSRYVKPRDSVLPGLPPVLVLQATNAGARRPGYKANAFPLSNKYYLHNRNKWQKLQKWLTTTFSDSFVDSGGKWSQSRISVLHLSFKFFQHATIRKNDQIRWQASPKLRT